MYLEVGGISRPICWELVEKSIFRQVYASLVGVKTIKNKGLKWGICPRSFPNLYRLVKPIQTF